MKYLILTFVLFIQINLHAQWVYGGGMKFNSNDDYQAIGLNAKVGKAIGEKFDLNTDICYYLATGWSFDFDLHYHLFNVNDQVILNPLAGINFTSTDVINNSLLLGASFRFPTDKYTYYLEPKWILDNNQLIISAGLLF